MPFPMAAPAAAGEELVAAAAAAAPTTTTPPPPKVSPTPTTPPGVPGHPSSPIDPIEPDDSGRGAESYRDGGGGGDDDDDDGYQSDGPSSDATTSISSNIRDYTWENNRRYHKYKEGRYAFPNDEPEQEREDMRHAMVLHLCGGRLHFAPIGENPQKILDVGTGTGIWAIDMGDEYPSAEITGIDLSPIQPSWVPPNVRFVVDDAEAPWIAPPDSLDYVHLRNMAFVIKDWTKLFQQAFVALKPGGWIELQDLKFNYSCDDGTMHPEDYGPLRMADLIHGALEKFGVDTTSAEKNPERAAAAGFVDPRHFVIKLPVGPWARDKTMKTVGLYNRSGIYDGLQGITMGPFTRGLGWSQEEVEVFLTTVRKDLMNARIHSYITWHSLCAQKPLSAAAPPAAGGQ
ncbi:methyltransferase type 12 [Apodospora peruviana]|uniref:Methyltransferase type 12 n=1 Tax=Apodospora peruviana TaxID=516989 RepID=A0AAE0M0N3_9PEZI|nr:methyltransferase type 12 [Apodospora peruviana]